jgi:hypothetical protein
MKEGRVRMRYILNLISVGVVCVILHPGVEAEHTVKAPVMNVVDTPNKQLIEAADKGDLERVQDALYLGAKVNAINEYGWTALHYAVKQGHTEVIRVLVENGVDVNLGHSNGRTSLHCAIQEGYVEIVALLLANGADIYARDDSGQTSITLAEHQRNRAIKSLINQSRRQKEQGMCPVLPNKIPREDNQLLGTSTYLETEAINDRNYLTITTLKLPMDPEYSLLKREIWESLTLRNEKRYKEYIDKAHDVQNKIIVLINNEKDKETTSRLKAIHAKLGSILRCELSRLSTTPQ